MIAIRWKAKDYGAIVKLNPTVEVNLINDVLSNIDSNFISFKLRLNKLQACEDRPMNEREQLAFQTNGNLMDYLDRRWSDFSSIVELGYYLTPSGPTYILDLDNHLLIMGNKQMNLTKRELKSFLNQKVFETIF